MASYTIKEPAIDMPSIDLTTQDGYRVVHIDLNNGRFMWDQEVLRQQERNTSWYVELSAGFPTHMLIVVPTTKDAVDIYDRRVITTGSTPYITFTASASNFLAASSAINDVDFKDMILYVADDVNGLQIVDLIRDFGYQYLDTGLWVRQGDVGDRNGALGSLNVNTVVQLNHADVKSVSVDRDEDGLVERETGRPLHDVLICSGDEISLIKAQDVDSGEPVIYDSGFAGITPIYGKIVGGHVFATMSEAGNDFLRWILVSTIASDAWSAKSSMDLNATNGGEILPLSAAAVLSHVDAVPEMSMADGVSPVVIVGSDEGVTIKHLDAVNEEDSITFFIDSIAAYPPLCGPTVKDAWPLSSVSGLLGKTLTNGGSTTFAAAVTGNGAVFTGGGATVLSRTADADFNVGTNDHVVGFYFKSTASANPGSSQNILNLEDAGGADLFEIFANTSGQIVARVSDDSAASWDTITTTPDYYDARWHALVFARIGSNWHLFIDGRQAGTTAVANAAAALDYAEIYVGNDKTAATGFGGTMDDLFFWERTDAAGIHNFARAWHIRMLRALNTAVATVLGADDVDYVAADPENQHFILGNQDKAYAIDWFGIVIAQHATPGGVVADADIWALPGNQGYNYSLVTNTRVNVQQIDASLTEMLL